MKVISRRPERLMIHLMRKLAIPGLRHKQPELSALSLVPPNMSGIMTTLKAALETALREPRRAEQERDDYSSFSAGGREGDEVPRE